MDIKEVDAIKKGRKVCKKYESGDALEERVWPNLSVAW